MKKISFLLAVLMILSCVACGAEPTPTETTAPKATVPATTAPAPTETTVPPTTVPEETEPPLVTIYIPEVMTVHMPDGTLYATITYDFEEGWQEKESFTVTYGGDAALMGLIGTITYADRAITIELEGINRTVTQYDENGRVSRQDITYLMATAQVDKNETEMTYDEYGRVVTIKSTLYNKGQENPSVDWQDYTYVEIEEGSLGTYVMSNITNEREYDKDYRLIAQNTLQNGQVISRTEFVYDEFGNQINQITFSFGQKAMEMRTTYIAVEVSPDVADRLPTFVKVK